MPFIPHKWLAPSANTALLFERSRWNVQDMHSLSYWTCQFFQFSPSSSQFWSFSIPALSCATVVSVTGIIQVKVGMEALPSRAFLAPITCLHMQPTVLKLQGEGMKRRERWISLHTASFHPPGISRENWMLGRRGKEREGKKENPYLFNM